MPKITFVGTAHDDNGICNDEALLKILLAIEPDVIFEEIRPSDFNYFYKLNSTLECKAVTKYCQYKAPMQVAVDQYEIPRDLVNEFRDKLSDIFSCVDEKTDECWLIKDELDKNVGRLGFEYLNSFDHAKKWEKICEIQDRVVLETGNQSWIQLLKMYRQTQHERDANMLSNIYEFCAKHPFDSGVFLVGASHKMGIVKEIEKRALDSGLVNWRFSFDGQSK